MKLACLCYLRKNNQTLMLLRNKKQNDVHSGKYNGLGGKLEVGESPEQACIREVQEESGLLIQSPEIRGFLTFPNFFGEDWYVWVYTASKFTGKLLSNPPEGSLHWIPDNEIFNLNLWEGDPLFLKALYEGKFFSIKIEYDSEGKLKNKDLRIADHIQIIF